MDIKVLRERIRNAIRILEDATTASLAPYPVMPVGSIVTTTKKKKDLKDESKEKSNS